ncbi:hypothetical protein ABZW32_37175 [Streptomyces sp. NPDC004667]|uniref:GNAT family N-acetyltransferase n=1 Tax=Streptomyces sp. NPDC004667 TaxID=3154285 RepID=UPI0033AE877D
MRLSTGVGPKPGRTPGGEVVVCDEQSVAGASGKDALVTLWNDDGSAAVRFRSGRWQGRPRATGVRIEQGSPEEAAAVLLRELPGWIAVTDGAVAGALVAAGAEVRRRSHRYRWDLDARRPDHRWLRPPLPPTLTLRPAADIPVEDVHGLWLGAYAAGHPDRVRYRRAEVGLAELAGLWRGDLLGPMLPFSSVVTDGRGPVAVMTAHALGAPLITQLFRDLTPRGRGMGPLLIRYALAAAAESGLHGLGGSVTAGNRRSGRLLEHIGFEFVGDAVDLDLPPLSRTPEN